jgi:hypothetical protein
VEVSDVAQNKEAMRATWRNPESVVGFGIEHISVQYTVGGDFLRRSTRTSKTELTSVS